MADFEPGKSEMDNDLKARAEMFVAGQKDVKIHWPESKVDYPTSQEDAALNLLGRYINSPAIAYDFGDRPESEVHNDRRDRQLQIIEQARDAQGEAFATEVADLLNSDVLALSTFTGIRNIVLPKMEGSSNLLQELRQSPQSKKDNWDKLSIGDKVKEAQLNQSKMREFFMTKVSS